MNKYNSSKIYILKSDNVDKVYVGSTCSNLKKRLTRHKSHYKTFLDGRFHYLSSFEICKYDDVVIELVCDVNCESMKELRKIENDYIIKLDCVNKKNENFNRKKYNTEYSNKYYHKNKKYLNRKYKCKCGSVIGKMEKARHEKSNKHKLYITNNIDD